MIQNHPFSSNAGAYSTEQQTDLSISPDLLWRTIQNNFSQVAWRKAISPQKQVNTLNTLDKDEAEHKPVYPTYNQSKLTGSPAFKELKNLIITILSNNRRTKPQQ